MSPKTCRGIVCRIDNIVYQVGNNKGTILDDLEKRTISFSCPAEP
jgi:hypothetical protein